MKAITQRLGGYVKMIAAELAGDQQMQDEGRRDIAAAAGNPVPSEGLEAAAALPDGSLAKPGQPLATYRLQMRAGMTFRKAEDLVPYWQKLGISHLYLSPIFKAVEGSSHGYDVTDFNVIDPAIGGHEGLDRLAAKLHAAGMSLILDMVPNHMAASPQNPWWFSVLEWGQASPYGQHFDITWTRKLTLPFLPCPLSKVLERGELRLALDRQNAAVCLCYAGMNLPIAPSTYGLVLDRVGGPAAQRIAAIASRTPAADGRSLHAEIQGALADEGTAEHLDASLAKLSEDRAFLDELHGMQVWRLSENRGKNYRRFFDISGLAGLRIEDPKVFEDTHRLVLDLVRNGSVDGLRIDHVDGLARPQQYLERVRAAAGRDLYLVVEKILMHDESMPPNWPVNGSTGYEFICTMGHALVDSAGRAVLDENYRAIAREKSDPAVQFEKARRQLITEYFADELESLMELAIQVRDARKPSPAATDSEIGSAVRDLLVFMPVYRSYANGEAMAFAGAIREAFTRARQQSETPSPALDLMQAIFTDDTADDASGTAKLFRTRFEQITPAIMAKSMEDTFFYRHRAFLALNEVGDGPLEADRSLPRFHERMEEMTRSAFRGLDATSTHDTKLSEDARARLYVLSEAPNLWSDAIAAWQGQNARFASMVDGTHVPGPTDMWLIYQALAALWPSTPDIPPAGISNMLTERLVQYLQKALREAKSTTSWMAVNEPYEAAMEAYVRGVLSPDNLSFLEDFARRLKPFVEAGLLNSLSQLVVKMTAPNAPDIYQGCETLAFSLVDPDNRRPVDFAELQAMLAEGNTHSSGDDGLRDGRLKFLLTEKCLGIRARHRNLFERGAYRPLDVQGPCRHNVIAFERRLPGEKAAIVIAPRLSFGRTQAGWPAIPASAWTGTSVLPKHKDIGYCDLISGAEHTARQGLHLADILARYPVSILLEK